MPRYQDIPKVIQQRRVTTSVSSRPTVRSRTDEAKKPPVPDQKTPTVPTYNVQDIQIKDVPTRFQSYASVTEQNRQNLLGSLFGQPLVDLSPTSQFGADYFSRGTSQGLIPEEPFQSKALYPPEVASTARWNEAAMFGAHELESGGRGLPGGYDYEGAFDSYGNLINVDLLPNMMSPIVAEAMNISEEWRNYMYLGEEDGYALRPPEDLAPDDSAPGDSYGGTRTASQWGYPSYPSYASGGAYPWGLVMWRIT